MATICAITDGAKTVIGSDRTRQIGCELDVWDDAWIVRRGIALGFSGGDYTVIAALSEHIDEIIQITKEKKSDKKEKIVNISDISVNPFAFVNEIKNMLIEYGMFAVNEEDDNFPNYRQSFLLAFPGAIWVVNNQFGLVRLGPNKLHVYGGGQADFFAAGVAHTLKEGGVKDLEKIIQMSLQYTAAATNNVFDKFGQFVHTI